jgi:cobalt ECF transporter T component CbiQ
LSIRRRKPKKGFLERTVENLTESLDHAANASRIAEKPGLLQELDPRVKICGALVLIIGAISTRRIEMMAALFLLTLPLIALSHISFRIFLKQAWICVLWFTGLIALPAIFTTPGIVIGHVPGLPWPVTSQGVQTAVRLVTRAETAATIALLLVLSTPWPHLLKALRVFRVPVVMVMILGMTHRYIFLLLHLARDLFVARRSRQVGPLSTPQLQKLTASSAGVLMNRSLQLSEEVFLAMQSRGFNGEIHLIDDFHLRNRDGLALAFLSAIALLIFITG